MIQDPNAHLAGAAGEAGDALKGPWLREQCTVYKLNDSGFNAWSAQVQDAHTPLAERLRVARLMEAAPDMLEVLLKLRRGDLHQRVRPLFDAAQSAIAKATGSAQ